ncbi:6114_t:CDS:1 [Acaulospora colombiana]|uniref:6114_t:CDS:1 n=1 Tax=Acaulospora colombiana TaxID=27376 RepID=A0ACA9JWS4_9GLOM|nr:6114_t:CDS:1 [Acaulospora colombiana]
MPNASEINIDEFINRPREKYRRRSPNGFFVYRSVFVKELLRHNHKLEMVDASKLASTRWRKEDAKTREEYKRIAAMVDKKLKKVKEESWENFHRQFIPWKNEKPPKRISSAPTSLNLFSPQITTSSPKFPSLPTTEPIQNTPQPHPFDFEDEKDGLEDVLWYLRSLPCF